MLVSAPTGPAVDWILSTVLSDWLGLQFERVPSTGTGYVLTLDERHLVLPDVFFKATKHRWLAATTLPVPPVRTWDTSDVSRSLPLIRRKIPVLYGQPGFHLDEIGTGHLNVDVFGSAFFMLSRYEEAAKNTRDEHGRFPAHASIAASAGFLDRPIVDEYTELLWAAIAAVWPRIRRRARHFRIIPTHDADSPSRFAFTRTSALMRSVAGDILKRRDYRNALMQTWIRLNSRKQIHRADPFNTFDWLMDTAERHQLTSVFYFFAGRTNELYDGNYELSHPAIRSLLKKIVIRGHALGIHPSYETFRNASATKREVQTFRSACQEEGIELPTLESRMHYLRWETPTTLAVLQQANIDVDSSMGFADSVGFRCGTCHEYRAFDVRNMVPCKITIRPLIAMETTVFSESYLGINEKEDVLSAFSSLRDACRTVSGSFVFLWHNSSLESPGNQQIFQSVMTC